MFTYDLNMHLLSSTEGKPILQDKLSEVAASLISAYDSGELLEALREGHSGWQKWVKSFGKSIKRKVGSCFCAFWQNWFLFIFVFVILGPTKFVLLFS